MTGPADIIQVQVTPESRELYADEVLRNCYAVREQDRTDTDRIVEIPDDVARVIATYFHSPGTVGHVLASLGSGLEVTREELSMDISHTIAQCYGKGDVETDVMLDCLGTWAINVEARS